ncbi:MAG: phage portal protein [Candidatus Neomarinimicrobiota bacterium]
MASSRIDKFASWISPSWGLKRQIARNRAERMKALGGKTLANIRGFEAVSGDRLRYDTVSTNQNVDSFIANGGTEALRQHVRYMEFQTGFVRGPISRIVNNVVGSGFQFQARIRATDDFAISEASSDKLNRSIERGYAKWCKESDQRLIHQFWTQLRQIEGALVRDGEVLVVGRQSNRPGRFIPYCQQVLEVDRLRTPPGEITNPRMRDGILYDSEGVPEIYFILKRHPGDTLTPGIGLRADDYEEIPAFWPNGTRKVFYLFNPIRPEQLRGFSMFGPALKDMQDLDRYREAEIMAALEDACMTGIVKTDSASIFQDAYTQGLDANGNRIRIHDFAPLKWHYLNPGEEASIHSPQRPNTAFGEFTEQLQMGPANALDIPTEVMTQNWHGLNYSNARTILLQLYMVCRIRQKYLIDYYASPTYECVLSDMVANGRVKADRFYAYRDEYLAHTWIAPGQAWVDPDRETSGIDRELNNNTENLARVWARKGEDWEEQLEIEARILRKKKELEAKYDIIFPNPQKDQGVKDDKAEEEPGAQPAKPKRMELVK